MLIILCKCFYSYFFPLSLIYFSSTSPVKARATTKVLKSADSESPLSYNLQEPPSPGPSKPPELPISRPSPPSRQSTSSMASSVASSSSGRERFSPFSLPSGQSTSSMSSSVASSSSGRERFSPIPLPSGRPASSTPPSGPSSSSTRERFSRIPLPSGHSFSRSQPFPGFLLGPGLWRCHRRAWNDDTPSRYEGFRPFLLEPEEEMKMLMGQ